MNAVIIGSGLSGLTAGAYLAKAGCRVTVLEQNGDIGGVTMGIRREGFSWDMGQLILEGFGPGEQAGYILEELGIFDRICTSRADRTYSFPEFVIRKEEEFRGLWWRRDYLARIFPAEKKGLDAYYRLYVRFMELVTLARRAERSAGLVSLVSKVRMYLKLLPLLPRIGWNARRMIARYFADERLQGAFISILADFVVRPSQFPGLGIPAVNPEPAFDARVPLEVSRLGRQPSYRFIDGGCRPLVDALAGLIREHGGEIRTGAAATGITLDNGAVSGVACGDGTTVAADIVVASGGAKEVFFDLVGRDNLPAKFAAAIDDIPLMESIFMIQLGVEFDPRPFQRDAVVYYYRTYDIEGAVERIQSGRYHEGNDGFLICIPSYYSPSMAPQGCHAVTIYTIAPNSLEEGTWGERRDEFAGKLLDLAEGVIPGLRAHERTRVVITPDDFKRITHLRHHAFGGCAPVMGKKGAPHRTPVRGLWFVGAQSESGAGINNVLEGTWRAVRMLRRAHRI
ncbi:MAG: NAD(P)/FAD-dependent oxidoreductase [Spirochaetes bacterium]|nr:NAD(P)/FAD-dependent oxidoreductase [Spirochaetota bacterium]